jgi:hypothetical protein
MSHSNNTNSGQLSRQGSNGRRRRRRDRRRRERGRESQRRELSVEVSLESILHNGNQTPEFEELERMILATLLNSEPNEKLTADLTTCGSDTFESFHVKVSDTGDLLYSWGSDSDCESESEVREVEYIRQRNLFMLIISNEQVCSIVVRVFGKMPSPSINDTNTNLMYVYGLVKHGTNVFQLPKEMNEAAQCTDCSTGEMMPPEPHVVYM